MPNYPHPPVCIHGTAVNLRCIHCDELDSLRAKIAELEADRDRAWKHYAECAGTPLMADVMGERDALRAKIAELECQNAYLMGVLDAGARCDVVE